PRDLREVYWDDARRRQLRAVGTGRQSQSSVSAGISQARHATSVATQSPPQEDRLARILNINRELAAEHDLARLLGRVTDHAIALLRAERGFVILENGGELTVYASRDRAGDDPHARFSKSIAEQVISSGQPVVSQSARDDDRMAGYLSVHQL